MFGIYRGLGLNGTLTGLIIGHTVLHIPYVVAMSGKEAPLLVREAQLSVRGDKRPVAVLFPRHSLHVEETP